MSIALPEQLNFDKHMPIDGGSKQQMTVAVPCTGAGTYNLGTYFMINLPRCGPDYVFDGANSFLRFLVTNNDTTNGHTLDHSCDCLFQKVEILHGGAVLETIDNYHQLSHILLDAQVPPNLRNTSLNMTKGCNATLGTIAGVGPSGHGGANPVYYTTTLISGIVGSLCRGYLPVNDLNGSIQIRITIVSPSQVTWDTAAPATPTAANNVTLSNIEFHCNMIRLDPSVMSMIRSPEYTMYSESYSNFQQSYGTTGFPQLTLLIPTRYSSLKTAFVIFRKASAVTNATYLLYTSARSTFGLTDYQFLLGSDAYPPTKIKGTGSGYCECFEELKKSFHCGGSSLASMGILNNTNYSIVAASGANAANTGTFILACDFESYTGRSGSILSGVSTLGSDLYLNATFGNSEAATIDMFLHYDIKLIIKDGILTVNV